MNARAVTGLRDRPLPDDSAFGIARYLTSDKDNATGALYHYYIGEHDLPVTHSHVDILRL